MKVKIVRTSADGHVETASLFLKQAVILHCKHVSQTNDDTRCAHKCANRRNVVTEQFLKLLSLNNPAILELKNS